MINLNASVEQPTASVARPQSLAISAAGVNDAASLARQQLPNAVPAPALIAAYSANVPPQPKLPPRPTSAVPSSALAAQFIAQGVLTLDEAAEIFTPAAAASTPTEQLDAPDDYLVALRVARGDVAAANANPPALIKPSQETTQAVNQRALENTKTTTNAVTETLARTVVAQAATGLPALFTQLIRRPSIITARGFAAYQLAEARNAVTRKPVAAS
jgi:hypothetical protein